MKTIGVVWRGLGLQRTTRISKVLWGCREFSCTNGKYFVSDLVQTVLEKLGSFDAPKLARLGSKICSVSSGGMEKNLLGLGIGYGPGQLDQWMEICWLGWHPQGGELRCLIKPGGWVSRGDQRMDPHCCCYSCDGLRHRVQGC